MKIKKILLFLQSISFLDKFLFRLEHSIRVRALVLPLPGTIATRIRQCSDVGKRVAKY